MSASRKEHVPIRQVVVGLPHWGLGGVSTFSANLVGGLNARGILANVLLTEQACGLVNIAGATLAPPADVPTEMLSVQTPESWSAHWSAMIRYLEERAPCIYIPNHDWRHSCISPKLSADVSVVGVLHSDDPLHYDHVARLGRFWDAVVTVSPTLERKLLRLQPELRARVTTIPIGVPMAAQPVRSARSPGQPLRIVYHGVLTQHQKRIFDLAAVITGLVARGVPATLTIAGGGADERRLADACGDLVERGIVRFMGVIPLHRIPSLLDEHDAYVLTSEFEGLPNALLEAMGRGCVPVVSRAESGIPDVVADGVNGFSVPIGDVAAFVERLSLLAGDPRRQARMAVAARQTVTDEYGVDTMVDRYVELFDRVRHAAGGREFRRPRAEMRPPPVEVAGSSILPGDYRRELRHVEHGLGWTNRVHRLVRWGRL